MKTTKTILTKIVHILIVIFTGKTLAFFTETVAEGTTVSGEIVAPQEWDGLNRNHQRVFGTVTDTILRGDSQNYSPPNWAQQDVFMGGYTNNITVENTGNQDIFGGTAENTVIKDEGRATLKNQGIFKYGKVYKGGFFSAQSGTVDNINVYENGQFDISGNDDGVIVEGGEITHGAKGVFMGKARINNLKISGDVDARASRDNPHFSHAYIGQLGQIQLSAGKITESTIEGGLLSVAHSEASDTTMKGGSIEVGEGGILKRTQMTGGSLDIKDGGLAEVTVVNGGGRMSNYNGTDIDTVINSGTYTLGNALSTTAQSNNLTLGNQVIGKIRKGTVNGANIDGQMILGFERLSSTLKGDVTVGEHGQLDVDNGDLDTHEANLNLSGRVNLKNDSNPRKESRFGKVSMNQGNFYFDYSISGGFSKNYSRLFLETLSGTGTFSMNTDIAGHKGDFLNVRGEANGHFGVMVTDSGKSPEPEDSLKIIQTGGGEAEFTLANLGQVVDVGTYQYHLVPDDLKRGWSLVSHQPQPPEKPQPESEAPVPPSVTETVAASRPISGDTLLPQETEYPVQPGIGSPKATELKPAVLPVPPSAPKEKGAVLTPVSGETVAPAVTDETQTRKLAPKAPEPKPEVPVTPSVHKEKETVLTPVSGETVAPAVTDETQTRKLAPKAPEPKPEVPVTPSVHKEKETVLTPVSGETVAPAVTDETQTRKLAPKAPEPKPEVPVTPSVPKEKETVLTPVSGETVAPAVTDEIQTRKLAPKAPEPKPEVPVTPSVEKEGEKKVAPNRLLSPPTNVSRTNRVPHIPSITPSTAAVLSMSTVDPLIYHSEMAQIQERMSSTRQAKTESAVWVKLMNERHNISQKAGDGYGLKLNGISLGADRTIRLGRSAYTTQGLFFTHGDARLNFRGKAIGGGNVSSWSAGTYAAYYHDSGFWLDGILKANRFSQEIHGKMTGGGDAFGDFSTFALGASIRGGKDMLVGEMTFTPYLSLSGLRTTRSSVLLSNGMKGDISAQRSALGKVGLRAVYQTRIKEVSVTPWVDVGAEREFIKNNRVLINKQDSFDNDLSGITGVYSLGLSANMSETFNVSATAGYKKGKHVESPWSASLGMSWKF